MADAMTATTPATAAPSMSLDTSAYDALKASNPSGFQGSDHLVGVFQNGMTNASNHFDMYNGRDAGAAGEMRADAAGQQAQFDKYVSNLKSGMNGNGAWENAAAGWGGGGGGGSSGTGAGSGVAQASQTMRSVDPATETVAGQVAGIINQNSPLMQQARAGAMSAANDRGLINSSLAVGAGQNAVLNAATPIATSDANVYGNAANINTNTANSLAASNAAALNAARQQEQALAQDTAKSQLSANTQLSLGQLDAMTKSSIASGSNATQLATATLNSETQKSIANLNAQTDTYKANLSAGTQTQVANIEANYKTLMQSSVLASQAMQDYTKNIYAIENNTNMDAATKQAAYDTEASNLKATMGVLGPINNLNLSSLLNFGSPAQVQAPTDTATAASTNSGPASFDSTG